MRLNKREVSLRSNNLLNMESSKTGMTWKRYGTTPSIASWEFLQRNIPSWWLRLPWTPNKTEREWLRSCLKFSMFHACTSPSKACSLSTHQVEHLVLFWIQVTVSHILFPSTKVMPYLTLSKESIWLVETWLSIFANFWQREGTPSPLLLNSRSWEISKRRCATSSTTLMKSSRQLKSHTLVRRITSFLMVARSWLETKDSSAQKFCFHLCTQAMNLKEFTNTATIQ